MASRTLLRMALRVSALTACLASLAARPALACYCVEYCSSLKSDVIPPIEGEGQAPEPNSYLVEITWTPYPGAPSDCQYMVEGSGEGSGGEWIPQPSCTVQTNEAGEAYRAECVVTASTAGSSEGEGGSEQPVGVTWTFRVSGDSADRPSADSSCTTDIFLPGTLDAPPDAEGSREGADQITIQWGPPEGRQVASGRSALHGYRIYRSADSDPTRQLIGTATETRYVDQGLTASESYTYEIYAADQYGVGRAAVVRVAGDGASSASGGCSSAAPAMAPLGLALLVAGVCWRRRRSRA